MKFQFNRNLIFVVIIFILAIVAVNFWGNQNKKTTTIPYSTFKQDLLNKKIGSVVIQSERLMGKFTDGKNFETYYPKNDPTLIPLLDARGTKYSVKAPSNGLSTFWAILINWFPMLLLIGVWLFFMRQMQGGGRGGGGIMGFGKSKARLIPQQGGVTFKDVAGISNIKRELSEVVDFLKFPKRYHRIGAKIPQGVLLMGPPGTGKTLLAKAVAGEAGVPFFNISGSDFVEMFVGVGASRVRDMFVQARKYAPCIIFVDELDAVGRHRGAGLGGGNDEREQTLNQILVEMDGLETTQGVIILAATNRPDVLDPALLRPGRFDRQVVVPMPDVDEREAILKIHIAKIKTMPNINFRRLAQGTPGFSGAELANLINEAAIYAVRKERRIVMESDLEEAKDKIMMGIERPATAMSKEELTITAYHEAGHAVTTIFQPASDPIHKATIVPRGRALGMVMRLPEKDQYTLSYAKAQANLVIGLGGRVAEELIFGLDKITSGASSDIHMVTDMARKMVTEWGFSKKLGNVRYSENQEEVFLGHSVSRTQQVSEKTMENIDSEIKRFIHEAKKHCYEILSTHKLALKRVAEALLKYETLTGGEVRKLVEGKRLGRKTVRNPEKNKNPTRKIVLSGSFSD